MVDPITLTTLIITGILALAKVISVLVDNLKKSDCTMSKDSFVMHTENFRRD